MNGGKREGAGRPLGSTKDGARREVLVVRVTEEERRKAEHIGGGNASEGIRIALGRCS